MKKLIVNGDAGFRKEAIVEVGGEEYTVFQVNKQGEWHGPERPQLWCVIGDESERETYVTRDYTPHWLDVERVDAEDVTVVRKSAKA